MNNKNYVLAKLPKRSCRRLPTLKKIFKWLSSNGGAVFQLRWDFRAQSFQPNYIGEDLISSHLCVLFTHDGTLLHFTAHEQEDILGLPLGADSDMCLDHQYIYYYDVTFGRCIGGLLFVTDLPMKSFACLDGTSLVDKCTR